MEEVKVAVISDIHSNFQAFKACVDYMEKQGIEEYLFLGDYVSDTSETKETMDFLYEIMDKYKTTLIRGNREEYMLKQREVVEGRVKGDIWPSNSASGNLKYSYERLTKKDLNFFDSLPICTIYQKEDFPAITCCHGSPTNARELMELYGENTKSWMEKIDTEYLLAAHTHFPGKLEHCGKTYMNSGCVGISINDQGLAQCTILHGIEENGRKKWIPEFLKIPYDVEMVVEKMKSSGLHEMAPWFINSNIQILLTGVDNSAKLVALTQEIQTKSSGQEAKWPYLEEKYFKEAAGILGVPDYR